VDPSPLSVLGAGMTGRGAWRTFLVILMLAAASLPWAAVAESSQPFAGPQPVLLAGELSLLARVVQAEAQSEPAAGQRAVAWTAINRLRAGGYGRTLQDVLQARHQYAHPKPRRPESPAYQAALTAAVMAARGDGSDDSRGATHFLRCDMRRKPAWVRSAELRIALKHHCFYRLKD
jgi:spore germination cell wall hydrolase CwlJ-like protein